MRKSLVLIVILVLFLCFKFILNVNNVIVTTQSVSKIFINSQSALKKPKEKNVFEAVTLNTKANNKIIIGKRTYNAKLKTLSKDKYIKIFSLREFRLYKIRTLPFEFPEYKLETKEGHTSGYLFVTVSLEGEMMPDDMDPKEDAFGYAVCFKTDGSIVFYYQEGEKIRNFVKHVTADGKVRYSFHVKPKDIDTSFCPLCTARICVLDENFSVIKGIAKVDNRYSVDFHTFKLIDDEHYIVNSYVMKNKIYFPQFEKEMRYHYNILREIENNRIKYTINFDNYPEFLTKYNVGNSAHKVYVDPTHVNSVIIDPKDNNLIISLSNASCIVKVNRKTQEIMWILGGRADMFGLTREQKSITQHSLSYTEDGYLTLLNNNCHIWINDEYLSEFNLGEESEILQYKIDEENKKLIDFRKIPLDLYIYFQGSAYQLSENRYIVGTGIYINKRQSDNVKNVIAYEMDNRGKRYMTLSFPEGYITYKAELHKTLD